MLTHLVCHSHLQIAFEKECAPRDQRYRTVVVAAFEELRKQLFCNQFFSQFRGTAVLLLTKCRTACRHSFAAKPDASRRPVRNVTRMDTVTAVLYFLDRTARVCENPRRNLHCSAGIAPALSLSDRHAIFCTAASCCSSVPEISGLREVSSSCEIHSHFLVTVPLPLSTGS